MRYGVSLVLLEACVVLGEGFIIWMAYRIGGVKAPCYEPFFLSFSANMISLVIGVPVLGYVMESVI